MLCAVSAVFLAASGCGPSELSVGRARVKVGEYTAAVLAVLPATARTTSTLTDQNACGHPDPGAAQNYEVYAAYDLSGVAPSEVERVFDAVRERLATEGFAVTGRTAQRLELTNSSNGFTASVDTRGVGPQVHGADTLSLVVLSSCARPDSTPGP
ncbi:hypothetical protein [Kitasatospora sp. NPDC057198]|uniref:hypothetical protein n=1 Tax=Kitasatospora sp. NPDC057198 TaxID=3346046 RepID=UPI0036293068